MAEFREALNDEIAAATSSAASSAVPLINGKRIGLVGTFTHYAFTVESALMLPTDAQGDLRIQGRDPVAASVISIEGLAVTVSVSEDLGPFVPFARLQSDMVYMLRSLIRRIEDYGEQKKVNPAGNRLLGTGEVHGDAVDLMSALPHELLSRPHTGSLFEVWDVGPLRTEGGQTRGTPPPPENVPNREGVDPHGPDASEQVSGRQQISDFLRPNGVFNDVCAPKPCYLAGWAGPQGEKLRAEPSLLRPGPRLYVASRLTTPGRRAESHSSAQV